MNYLKQHFCELNRSVLSSVLILSPHTYKHTHKHTHSHFIYICYQFIYAVCLRYQCRRFLLLQPCEEVCPEEEII